MKVNFDGMRRNIAQEFNAVCDTYTNGDPEEVARALMDLRQTIAALLCVYDDSCSGDINDLSILINTLTRIEE
jgi:hypothetical protein